MNTTILSFGRFKGKRVCDTPQWYQNWLMKQDWFTSPKPKAAKSLHSQLNGWDGYSRKGQAIYDQIFEQEKAEGDAYDRATGWYDPGGMYYGID